MTVAEYNIFITALFVIVGTAFGSFFNVLIYRMPREMSVVKPRSSCPNCGHMIGWYENIPILSYLFLRGKCSNCKQGISIRYPLVEAATGLLSFVIYLLYVKPIIFGDTFTPMMIPEMLLVYLTLILIIPISLIDFEHYIIPDELSIGGLVLAALVSFVPGGTTPLEALYGVLAGGGSLYVVGLIGQYVLKKEAMGGGDIKMLAWFGALFGPSIAAGSIFLGAFAGLLIALFQKILGKGNDEHQVPFGPALYAGLFIAVFWGKEVWLWYASTMLNLPQN